MACKCATKAGKCKTGSKTKCATKAGKTKKCAAKGGAVMKMTR